MLLKIVAIFYAVCFSASLFDPTFYETPLRVVGFALGLGGLAALFMVAFKKHFLSQGSWRVFSVIYVGYQLLSVIWAVPKQWSHRTALWAWWAALR
ncbi:hypothetical protein [Bradyrhizobium cosmicum]|uniref:hypothetical protein n=1 Tax=Bradyrhizobium cosmicum TaxID=1404864 RepID=UPI0028EC4210|nr:hypothetical protein [Bradyrhizobium cosmicum]